jgi:hypothetical protein
LSLARQRKRSRRALFVGLKNGFYSAINQA